jgi:hypothetical protein
VLLGVGAAVDDFEVVVDDFEVAVDSAVDDLAVDDDDDDEAAAALSNFHMDMA